MATTETTKTYGRYAIALTAALGLFMAILDNTIVNVALTPMANALKTSLSTIQWVITAYFLAQAAAIPVAGYFATRLGVKRIFIACLALFTVGSFLCGWTHDATLLIIFRVIQGIGGGALFPLATSIAFGAFPPVERAAASALVGIPVLLAPVFGPTIGGLITDGWGWEYIFFVNVPIGIVAIFMGLRIIPNDDVAEEAAARQKSFDYIGLVLSILGVLAVVYAFSLVSQTIPGTETAFNPRGTIYGWGYGWVWGLLGAGVALMIAFAVYELRISKDPVMDLNLFRRYDFTTSSIISWLSAIVVFGSLFLLPVFLEQVRNPNMSPTEAGLTAMPQGIASAIGLALSGILFNRLGPRLIVVSGGVLLVISSFMLTQLTPTTDGWALMPALLLRGFGFGFTNIPVQTLALQSIVGPALPKANSLFTVTRQIFSSIGIAVLTTLFIQQTLAHAPAVPANINPALLNSPAVQTAIANGRAVAGTAGMNDVFWVVTIGTIVLTMVSLILPAKTNPSAAYTEASDEGEKAKERQLVMAE